MSFRVSTADWRNFEEDVQSAIAPFNEDEEDRAKEDILVQDLSDELDAAVEEIGDEPSDGSLGSAVKAIVNAIDAVNSLSSAAARSTGVTVLAGALVSVLNRINDSADAEVVEQLELGSWSHQALDREQLERVEQAISSLDGRVQTVDDDE